MSLFSRRAMLRASMIAASAAMVPGSFCKNLGPSPRSQQKVVVIGAGLAGLTAAFEIMRSGHEVLVLEARLRPGGRVFTIRDEFSDGLYAEAGAFDFGKASTHLLHYISMFGLPIYVVGTGNDAPIANDVYYLQGKRLVAGAAKSPEWPYQLSPDERELGVDGLWKKYVAPLYRQIGHPDDAGWPNAAARDLDAITINQYLRGKGASDAVIKLLGLTFLGEDFNSVSALADVNWQEFFERDNETWMTLKGGNDQLPKAFAARLGPRIRYGAAVRSIAQNADSVTLGVVSANTLSQVSADRAVVAIPFSILRRMQLDNSFSQAKRTAIANLRYASQVHIYLQSKSRFWKEQGLSGTAYTDLPVHSVFDQTMMQPGTRAILSTENAAENARIALGVIPEKRVGWALEQVSTIFPELAQQFEGGVSVAWDEEPWSLGGCATFAPGEMGKIFPHVATVEGRIHFAGEHTSTIFTMEGATRSGVRVVCEIDSL